MPDVWGREEEGEQTPNQNLVSLGNEIINVVDIEDDDRTALKTANTSDAANARALKVEGMAEIVANVFEMAPGSTGLLVSNASRNPFGRALKVQTPFEGDPPGTVTAEIVNESSHQSARALSVKGRTNIEAIDGEGDPNTIGLHVINRSDHDNAKALKVEGRTEINASMAGDPGLKVINAHIGEDSRAMVVEGLSDMTYSRGLNEDSPCLRIVRTGAGFSNAVALQAEGKSEVVAYATGNPASIGLQVTNTSNHANARALKVEGKTELGGDVLVGIEDNAGNIDATGGQNPQNLNIGAGASTADVNIGQAGGKVTVMGELRVTEELHVNDLLVAEAAACVVGNLTCESNVHLEADLRVDGDVVVGPGDAAALIDARNSQDLQIGTSASTADVQISRAGQTVDMMGQARLNGNNLIMNDHADLTTGSGFVYNQTGSGVLGESIDVFIGGSKVGYWDSAGWH